jgi:predicted RNase H-like nuclease (RuvC/YqgF family)
MAEQDKKLKDIEDKIKRLEAIVSRLASRVEYHERERQRLKTDLNMIYNALRK